METFPQQNEPDTEAEEELDLPDPWWKRLGRGAVAVIALVGVLYIFGGAREYFLLQRTPSSAEQQPLDTSLDAETVVLPLTVFVLTGEPGVGSVRDEADVQRLTENAARIWEQAALQVVVKEVVKLPVTAADLVLFEQEPHTFVTGVIGYDATGINVFLVPSLAGVNGISFGGTRSIAVADYTSVFDWRTLAHEMGHQLGLSHVPGDQSRLMYRGANGVRLSAEEIMIARERAARW